MTLGFPSARMISASLWRRGFLPVSRWAGFHPGGRAFIQVGAALGPVAAVPFLHNPGAVERGPDVFNVRSSVMRFVLVATIPLVYCGIPG